MGYFKEQQVELMSMVLEEDPFVFLQKQVQRVERTVSVNSWWLQELRIEETAEEREQKPMPRSA